MIWNMHSDLEGQHAFLSPSQHHWLNYDKEKLRAVWESRQAKYIGTELHEYAAMAIRLKRKQPKNNDTVNMYVNDAIGFHMRPEQPLFYSPNCFGTADAISYNERQRMLRIHDLKTGNVLAHMSQLEIYSALFLLEYGQQLGIKSPKDIDMELRIYQNGDVQCEIPDPMDISAIMKKIIESDKVLDEMQFGG